MGTFDQLIWAAGPPTAALILAALVLEAALPLHRLTAPLRLGLDALAREIGRRLDRARRGERTRALRGFLFVIVFVGAAAAVGWFLWRLLKPVPYGWVGELVLLALVMGARAPIAAARGATRRLSGHPASGEDRHAVARGAVEGLATGVARGVIGVMLWYAVLGLAGAFAYRMAGLLAHASGSGTRGDAFALAVVRFEAAASAIPAFLAHIALAIAAVATPGASADKALRTAARDWRKHPGLVDGWPVGAAAGALGLSLGKPGAWIGDGRARAEAGDVGRARILYLAACLVAAIPAAAAAAYLV